MAAHSGSRTAPAGEFGAVRVESTSNRRMGPARAAASTPAGPRRSRPRTRRRRTGRRLLRAVVLLPLLALVAVMLYVAVTFGQVWSESQHDGAEGAAPVDVLVVLGAAQYNGEPSGALRGRLDHAYALWEQGLARFILVTGGNQPGDRTTEGLTGFTYLRQQGVPEDAILVEVDSRSTWESLQRQPADHGRAPARAGRCWCRTRTTTSGSSAWPTSWASMPTSRPRPPSQTCVTWCGRRSRWGPAAWSVSAACRACDRRSGRL